MQTRRLVGKLALSLCATALSLCVAEAGLRVYFWSRGVARPDIESLLESSARVDRANISVMSVSGIVQPSRHPDVVYELRPNLRGTFQEREFSTNSFGMRSPEVSREKPEGVFRIIGLGDSFMFGWGVGQDQTYSAILDRSTDDSGRKIEFLNFGTPGYNTAMEVALYEHKARHFQPDLVLVHFVGNDFSLPHLLQPPRGIAPTRWYLVELVLGLLQSDPVDAELDLLPHDITYLPDLARERIEGQYGYMLGVEGFQRAIEKLAALTREDDVPVVLMAVGHTKLLAPTADSHGFTFLDPRPVFVELLEAAGIELTRKSWRRAIRLPKDIHPSPLAHRGYAEAVRRHLAELDLAPDPHQTSQDGNRLEKH